MGMRAFILAGMDWVWYSAVVSVEFDAQRGESVRKQGEAFGGRHAGDFLEGADADGGISVSTGMAKTSAGKASQNAAELRIIGFTRDGSRRATIGSRSVTTGQGRLRPSSAKSHQTGIRQTQGQRGKLVISPRVLP